MDEEMKKIKYRQLLNKLYTIRNKYQELDNVFDDLNATVKENLLIDDKNIKEDDFDDAKNSIISFSAIVFFIFIFYKKDIESSKNSNHYNKCKWYYISYILIFIWIWNENIFCFKISKRY